ncbi:tryptophan-rich sensory protein [Subtercola sp. YIM 133946]|uniref:tryptophan-rich sensory protein n=1 Tax=Subtercola sp. YIM 133946 TaxID=3118909 RepID=UPI002F92B8AF
MIGSTSGGGASSGGGAASGGGAVSGGGTASGGTGAGAGTGRDTARQVVVLVSAIIAVVGSFIGSGAAGGTPIAQAANGALGADATLIAPAVPAFAIWTPIYLGLVAYAVWQLLPRQRADARQHILGYPIALTLLLNAAWILSVQAGLLALSAVVIVLLLAALCWAFSLSQRTRPGTRPGGRRGDSSRVEPADRSRFGRLVETLLVDGTLGLYLGWVSIATAANLTALFQQAGFAGFGWLPEAWGVAIVVVAGLVGVLLAFSDRGRLAPAAALAWGLAWVGVSRLTGSLDSAAVGFTALAAAVVVLLITVIVRVSTARREPSAAGERAGEARASAGPRVTGAGDEARA